MTPAPIQTRVGHDLYDATEPMTWADEALNWPWAHYVDALGAILEETAALVRTDDAGNDGWTAFADPRRCPDAYLFTLAQWAGVRWAKRMSKADLRLLIDGQAPGLWRGTTVALMKSIRRYLEPDGQVYWEERADGDAYKLRVFTYVRSTLDENAIRQELLHQVPAGILLIYEVREGQDYNMLRDRVETYDDVKAGWPDYNAVRLEPEPT